MNTQKILFLCLLAASAQPMVINHSDEVVDQPSQQYPDMDAQNRQLWAYHYPHFFNPMYMGMFNPYLSMMMMAPFYMGMMNPMMLGMANPYLMGMFNPYATAMSGDMMRASQKVEKKPAKKADDAAESTEEVGEEERKLVEIKQPRRARLSSKVFNEDLNKLNDELASLIGQN